MSEIAIRVAVPAERSSLEALQWRASLANDSDREALLAHPDAIVLPMEQIAAGGVFVADCDGALAGFAALVRRPDDDAELDALFVEPHLWKHGIGRRLVDYVAGVARAGGARVLHVVGNPHASGFYTSCGFKQIGTVATRFGIGLDMRRLL